MAKYFITTPIYYVNDVPHIGSAYTTLVADVLARANRFFGNEVLFLTGTDEHGAKIAQKAAEVGDAPQTYADKIAAEFQKTWASLHISYDTFGRTTDPKHQYLVGQVMQALYDKKLIYPGGYEGWYCVACEEYKEMKPVSGKDKNPLCPTHQTTLEFIKEDIYYFALSKFAGQLKQIIESDQLIIHPESRKNEVLAFLTGEPLRDIPITRSKVSWGVPAPFAPGQTVYVWFDALLNYLTFSGENVDLAALQSQQTWWPADLQLLGKDISRFHAIIWPAMLLALDLPLPKALFVHGFFTINGAKMSKTTGNVIAPQELIERYGVDATRYLILSAFELGADGDISLEKFDATYTADLANGLGNLLQRTIVLINKFGIKPQTKPAEINQIKKAYLENDLTSAIIQTFILVNSANRYLAETQPWAEPNDALRETALVHVYQELQKIAEALTPVMPGTAERISNQLETLKAEPLFPRLNQ